MQNYVQQAEQIVREEIKNAGVEASDGQVRNYTLPMLTRGVRVSMSDVHDAWAIDRNMDRPDHVDLIPFATLSADVTAWDIPFHNALIAAAKRYAQR